MTSPTELPHGEPEVRFRPLTWVARIGTISGVALGAIGAFPEYLAPRTRLILGIIAAFLIVAGFSAGEIRASRASKSQLSKVEVAKQLARLADIAEYSGVRILLRELARPIFRGTMGWRLSVYAVEFAEGERRLRRLARISSTDQYEDGGRSSFALARSTLRELDHFDLSLGSRSVHNESGAYPERGAHGELLWEDLQLTVLKDRSVVEGLRMGTRKYAWSATRISQGDGQIIALVAESLDPDGIQVDALGSPLLPTVLELIVGQLSAPSKLEAVVDLSATELGLDMQAIQYPGVGDSNRAPTGSARGAAAEDEVAPKP